MRNPKNIIACWPALLAMLLVVALAMPAAADRQSKPAQGAIHERTTDPLPVVTVTIDRKSTGSVTTTVGDTFAVGSDTMIVNPDGHQVSIRKMLIPCEAAITYGTEQGERKATRIDIKQFGSNASWQWASPKPE